MQLQCPKCHAEIEENTLFCEQCGRQIRKLCPHCNNLVDMDAAFCYKCGNTLITEKKEQKKRGKWIIILFALTLLIGAAIFLFKSDLLSTFNNRTEDGVLYIKDGQLYYCSVERGEPLQITKGLAKTDRSWKERNLGCYTRIFPNGNIIYADNIENGKVELYRRNVNKAKEEPTRIDFGISFLDTEGKSKESTDYLAPMLTNKEGTKILYVKTKSKANTGSVFELYESDLKESRLLSSNVVDYAMSEDGLIIWYQTENAEIHMLQNEQDEIVESGITSKRLFASNDCKTIYFSTKDKIVKYTLNAGSEVLLDAPGKILLLGDGEKLFFTGNSQAMKFKYADVIVDKKESEDRLISKPSAPTEPNWWAYESLDAYEQAYSTYLEKMTAYKEANRKYMAAAERNGIRANVKKAIQAFKITKEVLYCYSGSKTEVISDRCEAGSLKVSWKYGNMPIVSGKEITDDISLNLESLQGLTSKEIKTKVKKACESGGAMLANDIKVAYKDIYSKTKAKNIGDIRTICLLEEGKGLYLLLKDGRLYEADMKAGKSDIKLYDKNVAHIQDIKDGNVMCQKTNSKVYINKKKIENCNKKSMFIADDSGDVFYMTGKDMNASVYRLTGKEKDELLLDGVQENCCISGAGFFYNKIGGRIKSLCFKDKNAEEKVVDTNVDTVVRTYADGCLNEISFMPICRSFLCNEKEWFTGEI